MIRLDFCHDARRQFGDLNAGRCAFGEEDLEGFGGEGHFCVDFLITSIVCILN